MSAPSVRYIPPNTHPCDGCDVPRPLVAVGLLRLPEVKLCVLCLVRAAGHLSSESDADLSRRLEKEQA
jgi:hypothetical protein